MNFFRSWNAPHQGAYEEAVNELFRCLDRAEEILSKRRYIAGDVLTDADVPLVPTLGRYDEDHGSDGLEAEQLMEVERVLESARAARETGSTRFCMGAAWRSPKDRDLGVITAMVRGVKELGMETCMTLGMLEPHQAQALAEAALTL